MKISLLIIADDFTGALDTGVQFQKRGIRTSVTTNRNCDFSAVDAAVLALDAETRHISAEEAKRTVFDIISRAVQAGVPCFYKKTDSVMRGNVGAELAGALEAVGEPSVCFVPAYPKAGRITVNGVQYLNGVPVAESVFGHDPFEPVRFSDVSELIGQQTEIAVRKVTMQGVHDGELFLTDTRAGELRSTDVSAGDLPTEIIVADAATDEDLRAIAAALEMHTPKLLAGCAGFAEMLPDLWKLPADGNEEIPRVSGMVVCSGSLSPVTFRQIRNAEARGFIRYTLTDEQRLTDGYVATEMFRTWLTSVHAEYGRNPYLIIEGENSGLERSRLSASRSNEKIRQKVARNLGEIYSAVIASGMSDFYVIVGGDTLFSVLKNLECEEIVPLMELSPGVVLSRILLEGEPVYLATKAGGLGTQNIFIEIAASLTAD